MENLTDMAVNFTGKNGSALATPVLFFFLKGWTVRYGHFYGCNMVYGILVLGTDKMAFRDSSALGSNLPKPCNPI